jgi:hypothetical protein
MSIKRGLDRAHTSPSPEKMQPIAECCGDLLNQEDLEMSQIRGISHIDLTVSNCERAAAWRQDVLGFTLVHRTRGETFETMSLVCQRSRNSPGMRGCPSRNSSPSVT